MQQKRARPFLENQLRRLTGLSKRWHQWRRSGEGAAPLILFCLKIVEKSSCRIIFVHKCEIWG